MYTSTQVLKYILYNVRYENTSVHVKTIDIFFHTVQLVAGKKLPIDKYHSKTNVLLAKLKVS